MTLTAEAKERVVLPGAAPGDVFTARRLARECCFGAFIAQKAKKKMTKKQVLAAIRRWKYIPAMSWEELRKLTRDP